MSRIRATETQPERTVRSLLHRLGFRFRLHRKNLPGKPDIVLTKHRTAIFVHGCFWHRHPSCANAAMPATNVGYWKPKLERNVQRDRDDQDRLREMNWNVVVVWECELRDTDTLAVRLSQSLS